MAWVARGYVALAVSGFVIGACGVDDDVLPSAADPIADLKQPLTGSTFGTYCSEYFENNWQPHLPYADERCSRFKNKLKSTDTSEFYSGLKYKKSAIEKNGDSSCVKLVIGGITVCFNPLGTDDMDLVYMHTHGQAWNPPTAGYTMWNEPPAWVDSWADTNAMRLGDRSGSQDGLSILATYACGTLNWDDYIWNRWYPAMAGGLKYVVGAYGDLMCGWTTSEVGEEFAIQLQKGKVIWNAWKDAVSDWLVTQRPAALVTGNTLVDCETRRDQMKWSNYKSFVYRRDGAIGWICGKTWKG